METRIQLDLIKSICLHDDFAMGGGECCLKHPVLTSFQLMPNCYVHGRERKKKFLQRQ